MTDSDLKNDEMLLDILDGTVPEVKAKLAALSVPDLERLAQLEEDGEQRKGVLEAIGDVLVAKAEESQGDTNHAADTAVDDADTARATDDALVVKAKDNQAKPNPTADATEGGVATDGATDGGKAARGEEGPAWRKPNYSGPLTIEQAQWRNQHIQRK